MAYRRYTDEDRIKALELIAQGYSLSAVSDTLNIPLSTVQYWAEGKTKRAKKIKSDHKNFEDFRREKKEEFIQKAWTIIGKTVNRLDKQLENNDERISARDLSMIAGILYDKQALASNEATVNAGIKIVIEGGGEGFAE